MLGVLTKSCMAKFLELHSPPASQGSSSICDFFFFLQGVTKVFQGERVGWGNTCMGPCCNGVLAEGLWRRGRLAAIRRDTTCRPSQRLPLAGLSAARCPVVNMWECTPLSLIALLLTASFFFFLSTFLSFTFLSFFSPHFFPHSFGLSFRSFPIKHTQTN